MHTPNREVEPLSRLAARPWMRWAPALVVMVAWFAALPVARADLATDLIAR
ncbi:MAG: hypothetical protein GY723_22010, partial [bacterium]|nr:hypothetical protein [bacterium]